MSTPRSQGWHRIASRTATAGMILGIASLAVGVFIMSPIANRSSSDDSPSSVATIALVIYGPALTAASVGLGAGETLRWRACRRRASRADGSPRPR